MCRSDPYPRSAVISNWSILAGTVGALSIATASVLAEELEQAIGAKAIPASGGFDFDDILFILSPMIWLGDTAPLVIGAAILSRLPRRSQPRSEDKGPPAPP